MGVFLAAAMFVFVIDASFINVSISAVVHDLDTTVSGVQAAVAIESLVSASFILISSKLGDLSAASEPSRSGCSSTSWAPWRWWSPRAWPRVRSPRRSAR